MEHLFSISKYSKGYCPNIQKLYSSSLSQKQKLKCLQSSISVYTSNELYINKHYDNKANNISYVDSSLLALVSLFLNDINVSFDMALEYFKYIPITKEEKSILTLYFLEHISIKEISSIVNRSNKSIKRIIDKYTEEAITFYEH